MREGSGAAGVGSVPLAASWQAWHDSGTFDKNIRSWPACGGANGSIRFEAEMNHGANAGLIKAVNVYLKPIKARHPVLSWADLLQARLQSSAADRGASA